MHTLACVCVIVTAIAIGVQQATDKDNQLPYCELMLQPSTSK
jgi:hypothetical protein